MKSSIAEPVLPAAPEPTPADKPQHVAEERPHLGPFEDDGEVD